MGGRARGGRAGGMAGRARGGRAGGMAGRARGGRAGGMAGRARDGRAGGMAGRVRGGRAGGMAGRARGGRAGAMAGRARGGRAGGMARGGRAGGRAGRGGPGVHHSTPPPPPCNPHCSPHQPPPPPPITHCSLHHLHPLSSQHGEHPGDVHSAFNGCQCEGHVYGYQCTCSSHASTAGMEKQNLEPPCYGTTSLQRSCVGYPTWKPSGGSRVWKGGFHAHVHSSNHAPL